MIYFTGDILVTKDKVSFAKVTRNQLFTQH